VDTCCNDKACELEKLRERQTRTLCIVLGINGVMFCLEMLVGILAGSVALQADSLDMLGDTLVYGFSLYAIHKSERWRAGSALLKGGIMAVFGLGVLFESGYKLLAGGVPESSLMGMMGVLALLANAICLVLLTRHKSDDLNMRSTWLCSRNDIIANASVLVAAALVASTHSIWPDVLVGVIITTIFLQSAAHVLREAGTELRRPRQQAVPPTLIELMPMQPLCAAGTCPANACRCGAL
jgi:cation diffusion facilitator family transporter